MSHPNEDFIKRFTKQNFENQTKKPIIEEAFKEVIIKSQKEIEESLKNPIKVEKVFLPKKEKPIVTDKRHLPTKKDILLKEKAIEKKYKSISPKELVEQNALAFKAPAQVEYKDWQPFKTPFGIFYFNKDTNQWMNNFGIIKNTLNDFLSLFDMSSMDGQGPFISGSTGEIPFESSLPLLRVVDGDIYGYMVERNHDFNSIDEYYPEFPYTLLANGLSTFGGVFNFLEIGVQDVATQWDSGLAGRAFMGGALGTKGDISGAIEYDEPGTSGRTWATNWITQNAVPGSLYDIGDTARRGVGSEYIEPSSFNKYQWYDFATGEVKGANHISIAAGYGGGVFITENNKKLSVPRTGYTTSFTITSAIYDLILNHPSIWSLECKNPDLISGASAYNITHGFGQTSNKELNLAPFGELKEVAPNVKNTLVIKIDGSLGFTGFDLFGKVRDDLPSGTGFIDIAMGGDAGSDWAIAAKENGQIAVWGRSPGASGVVENVPPSLSSKVVTQVAAGWKHAVVLTDTNDVICWGSNDFGQCTVPSGMTGLGNIVQIDARQYYSMALNDSGRVFIWGGEKDPAELPAYIGIYDVPSGLTGPTFSADIKKIAAGDYFAMALDINNTLYAWGFTGENSVLSVVGGTVVEVPSEIQGRIVDIAAGAAHALAAVGPTGYDAGNFIVAWGANTNFDGVTTNQATVPSTVYTGVNQTPYRLGAGHYHSVVLTNGGKIAPVAGLYGNDLDMDGVDDVGATGEINLVSVDLSTDQCLAMLDENGTVRILYNSDTTPQGIASTSAAWDYLTYFDEDWIANGFLTDDENNPVTIENRDFVSVTVSGGLLGSLIYVWCLHKSGRLYGVEITSVAGTTGSNNYYNAYNQKKNKFVDPQDPESGRASDFGTLETPPLGPPPGARPDEFKQYYAWSGSTVTGSIINGTCKEIAYVLNFIPKIDGVRFPVTSVWGGYISGGVATCINPTYTGYIPSRSSFPHPTQMCEVVKFQDVATSNPYVRRLLSRVQHYTATYNSGSQTWSYPENSNFDQQLYDMIYGVVLEVNNTQQLVYVPPRCVSLQRFCSGLANNESARGPGLVGILSNNGTWTPFAGNDVYVPCIFDITTNPNYAQEILDHGRVTMKGDFTLGTASFDYSRYGFSPLFNYAYPQASPGGSRWKIGNGPNPLSPGLVTPIPTLETYDESTMWINTRATISNTSGGWGNPPKVNGEYLSVYEIPLDGTAPDSLFGFSYFDYFGSTASDPPSWMVKETQYITNDVIVKVFAYGDTAGNYPVLSGGSANTGYTLAGSNIPVLAVADDNILDNPFAWIRSVGDLAYGIRLDGTIDLLSQRSLDRDGFVFDPFWGPCYPTDRYANGITFDSIKPANYSEILNQLKNVGSYTFGTYPTYNHYLPNL